MEIELLEKESLHFQRPTGNKPDLYLGRVAYETWGSKTYAHRGKGGKAGSLIIVEKGKLQYACPKGEHIMGPGDAIWMGPIHWHEFKGLPGETITLYVFDFNGRNPGKLVMEYLGIYSGWRQISKPNEALNIAEQLHAKARSDHPRRQQICTHLLYALLETVRGELAEEAEERTASEAVYWQCRRCLDRHFEDMIYPSEAAESVGITNEHMCRLFRKHAETTPGHYLLNLKMNLAAKELRNTSISIHALALRLGYSDAFSFSKSFKRINGQSPSHYRQVDVV